MEEILKEVLIKKCANKLHDQVLIVENLPSKFLFEQTRKLVPHVDRDGYKDGSLVVDPSGEMVWTLYPGIEKSQTGDGGFVFFDQDREAGERLANIMRYIEMSFSRDFRIPRFVDNAQQIGNPMSGPINYTQIPRVSLPVVASAPKAPEIRTEPAPTGISMPQPVTPLPPPPPAMERKVEKKQKGMSEANRQMAAERMRKMHQARRAKAVVHA